MILRSYEAASFATVPVAPPLRSPPAPAFTLPVPRYEYNSMGAPPCRFFPVRVAVVGPLCGSGKILGQWSVVR